MHTADLLKALATTRTLCKIFLQIQRANMLSSTYQKLQKSKKNRTFLCNACNKRFNVVKNGPLQATVYGECQADYGEQSVENCCVTETQKVSGSTIQLNKMLTNQQKKFQQKNRLKQLLVLSMLTSFKHSKLKCRGKTAWRNRTVLNALLLKL